MSAKQIECRVDAAGDLAEALERLVAVTEETSNHRAADPHSDPFCPICRALNAGAKALSKARGEP